MTGTSSKSHIIRGVLGGVAALLAIVAISMIVWRRRRQSHGRTSIGSPFEASGEVMSHGTQVTLTPSNPTRSALALPEVAPVDTRPQADSQARLVHRSSSLEDALLPLRRVVSVPVGLSSKELARLRRSPANGSRSQSMDGRPSNPPLTSTADRGALRDAAAAATPSPEAWVPRSEFDVLRHEIQRLHAVISESPPSYASGALQSSSFHRLSDNIRFFLFSSFSSNTRS
ncbi:hypothetical protein EDB92DRAFT_204443 [Lactarius akahatsu]|uniref:Transmembrane protein n=1 Tax=Lactarius akahatsu TaxID=416441 RepID=A0AAD4LK12_9AGAM|nr:hypothetical protein EDB92DRAFT_204443 [Lactarius akahatsu]